MDRTTIIKILIVQRLRRRLKRKQRSVYIRPIFLKRDNDGEQQLVMDLRDDPYYHFRYFRMSKENFDTILDLVTPMISHPANHIRPISPLQRLAITLRYLATGNSQISLAMSFRVSPSSVCGIIRETLAAINQALKSDYLPTASTWINNENQFRTKWNFPHACGSLDGKHIRIKCPSASGSLYFNYKTYFSIVLMALSDADFKFTAVDIGSYGSESDGGILAKSHIGRKISNDTFNLPSPQPLSNTGTPLPYVFLGDDAFPKRHNLLKPYKGNFLQKTDRVFNYRLSRARMTVENSFGIMAARWRIFHSVIEADVDLVKQITLSAVILHNYLMNKKDFNNITPDRFEDGRVQHGNWRDTVQNDNGMIQIPRQGTNNYTQYSAQVRNHFRDYFNSEDGRLSWQDHHVDAGGK
ncbi:protein ALP1-like [Folsomia candida]|uniref:protein ALP1-like n=1 Tax=Folsomia candida TaxID=158441 RepID=UPI000B8F0701|nr:protein ALP1-like [Folsomia candida]